MNIGSSIKIFGNNSQSKVWFVNKKVGQSFDR